MGRRRHRVVVRAVLDVVLADGGGFSRSAEIDGWTLLDAVHAHLVGEVSPQVSEGLT